MQVAFVLQWPLSGQPRIICHLQSARGRSHPFHQTTPEIPRFCCRCVPLSNDKLLRRFRICLACRRLLACVGHRPPDPPCRILQECWIGLAPPIHASTFLNSDGPERPLDEAHQRHEDWRDSTCSPRSPPPLLAVFGCPNLPKPAAVSGSPA